MPEIPNPVSTYPALALDFNRYDADGHIIELPIYTEMRPFWDFISPMRVFRMVCANFPVPSEISSVNEAF